jgi:hypothetical protein
MKQSSKSLVRSLTSRRKWRKTRRTMTTSPLLPNVAVEVAVAVVVAVEVAVEVAVVVRRLRARVLNRTVLGVPKACAFAKANVARGLQLLKDIRTTPKA